MSRRPGRPPSLDFNLFGLLFLFSVYTNVALWSGARLIFPSAGPLAVAVLFFAFNPRRLTRRLVLGYAFIALSILTFYVLGALNSGGFTPSSALTTVNFCYSVALGLAGFVIFTAAARGRTARTFAIFGALLLVGAALDRLGPLRPFSDAFRAHAYPAWLVYGRAGVDTVRDVALYGGYRPTVFASEPSIVGIWALVSSTGWLLLFPVRLLSRRTAIYLAYGAAMLWIVRSPTIIFCAPILLIARFTQGPGRPPAGKASVILPPLGFAAVAGAMIGLGGYVAGLPAAGALQFTGGVSFFERVAGPQFMAGQVLAEHPLLGIGIGNKEALWRLTQRLFLDRLPDAPQLLEVQEGAVTLVCNSFYLHWIHFGLAGGLSMLLCYAAFLRLLGIRNAAAVGCVVICVLFTLGGYTGTLVWSIILLIAAARLQFEQARGTAPAPVRVVGRRSALPRPRAWTPDRSRLA